jgi:cellulose biosynthesis protein BcsQ
MVTRPELVEIAKELDINYEDIDLEELKITIRDEADRRWENAGRHSADNLSYSLKRFLTTEWDYIIVDKRGDKIEFK